jgi:hypothetical protein
MRHLRVIQALALAVVLAWSMAAPRPAHAAGIRGVIPDEPDKPICPERPKDPTVKWPPSWCRLAPRGVSAASLLLSLTTVPKNGALLSPTVTYQIVAKNAGRGSAETAKLVLPIMPEAQVVLDARFSSLHAWISAALTDTLEMQLGGLGAGEVVTATVRLRTLATVRIGTNLTARAWVDWHSKVNGGTARSNRVKLTIIRDGLSIAPVPLELTPATGAPTTIFKAVYDGFSSNERVSFWYHQPDGRIVGLDEMQADAQGRITMSLSATALAIGQYTLVAYGQYSQVSATAAFTVLAS